MEFVNVHFVDGLIRVAYVDEHSRSDHSEIVSVSHIYDISYFSQISI